MIYLHIPFCQSKCHYCDFYSVAGGAQIDSIIQAMSNEIARRQLFFGDKDHTIRTLYFGGGTPSILTSKQVQKLTEAISLNFDLGSLEEFTFESNPEHLTTQYMEELMSIGINRLSIGVQSFHDNHLLEMNRKHTATRAIDAVREAQNLGLTNISIDLIYGLPFMSDQQWIANIDQAIALGVTHISAYHLSIEERTVFHKRGLQPIDEQRSEWQYQVLCEKLAQAGFIHYEISNFAKPNMHSKHNSAYWTSQAYLGIGPSAHSFDGSNTRSWNVANNTLYINGAKSESEQLTANDIHNEYLMTRLRTSHGVDRAEYESRFGHKLTVHKPIKTDDSRVYIAPEDWLVADSLIAPLFI